MLLINAGSDFNKYTYRTLAEFEANFKSHQDCYLNLINSGKEAIKREPEGIDKQIGLLMLERITMTYNACNNTITRYLNELKRLIIK